MGIQGIYREVGAGLRIALSKFAVQTYEAKGRPLRLAVDISIWLFQIQSSKGGTNPALRTFYYRLLRLVSLSVNPLFVFDGPNKPPFKRNKRTGANVASIPEFLAKQLLKQFGLPFHIAPGEAEAECALLQRKGIVDAVLSEDVDTLMFGSGVTMRNWSCEGPLKGKTPTHVNIYDAAKTKATSGLDREGMILVALMSGGDYIPEGVPGCGPKTACQAARAGFGKELCAVGQHDEPAMALWKARLMHELRTNESNFFANKHKALVIPEDFPRRDVLRYYTHPCLSSDDTVEALRSTIKWDQDFDIAGLRTFTAEAFNWTCLGGAKHFIRNLAPALLVKSLRLRGESGASVASDDLDLMAAEEAKLVTSISSHRQHFSTDEMSEVRIGYVPHSLVPIDLDSEQPDAELPLDGLDEEEEVAQDESGTRKRGPSTFDPDQMERMWIAETFVKIGVPLKMQDWEASQRAAAQHKEHVAARRQQNPRKPAAKKGSMPIGALDRYAKVVKPGGTQIFQSTQAAAKTPPTQRVGGIEFIDLASSPEQPRDARQRRPLSRAQTDGYLLNVNAGSPAHLDASSLELPQSVTRRTRRGTPATVVSARPDSEPNQAEPTTPRRQRTNNVIDLSTPTSPKTPTHRQRSIADWLPPSTSRQQPLESTSEPFLGQRDAGLRRQPLVAVSHNAVNSQTMAHKGITPQETRLPVPLDARSTMMGLLKYTGKSPNTAVVGLRDTFAGMWTLTDGGDPAPDVRKRKAGAEARQEKRWRLADIEVVDLSAA